MNTPSSFASALPTQRDARLIRRKAAALRAAHIRSLIRRMGAAFGSLRAALSAIAPGTAGARRA
ncbi:hypothetical protein [Azospirillum rugosum]|uniref:Uncharacterized protein n=1 Tax=Azospirillum rugosum TaxID=416170 RepID=A0ABS4SGU4_9PROT|nr:hypothetical protein [Azospirillum rugosum]MBP2291409.1 hypothetical protein [Azospirillum rugosum]MDQ0525197.1 hypothetical protein [Azospirillum rugosum]